jgi:hypothetical protein
MDLNKALRELYEEKRRLDSAIASLEARLKSRTRQAGKKRRGRKSMGPEERREVSRRMSLYWEARRAQVRAPGGRPSLVPAASNDN